MNIIISTIYKDHYTNTGNELIKIEFRLDLSDNLDEVKWQNFTNHNILTYRKEDPESQVLDKMLATKALIDLDYNDYAKHDREIPAERLILSAHFTDFDEELFISFLDSPIEASYYKLIFKPASFSEMLSTAELIAKRPHRKYIFNALGKWAYFQRMLYYDFNSIAAYFSILEPVVESQPSVEDIHKIMQTCNIHNLVLLIGSGDLSKSGSITWGNDFYITEYLSDKIDLNIGLSEEHISMLPPKEERYSYLPAPIRDIAELHEIINWLQSRKPRYNVFGLAITSPFKHEMAKYLKSHRHSVNTVAFWDEKTLNNSYHEGFKSFVSSTNTDIIALNRLLEDMGIAKDATIQLYGSGDCAYAFAAQLKRLGYSKLFLSARNKEKLSELSAALKLPAEDLKHCDLLINTTPLGLNEEDDLSVFPEFSALIDLAISGEKMSRLSELADEKEIPYCDGESFWTVQHMFQRKEIDAAVFSRD